MKALAVVLVLIFAAAVMAAMGALLAWLFAQFGIVHPWYVYSVGWIVLGLVAHTLRGSK